jgi:glutamate-1-semialdehyde aminotransferase
MKFHKGNAVWDRADRIIPAGTQTMSKAPDRFVMGLTPKYIKYGYDAHVVDPDGNDFIDYPMGLGAITLGYGIREIAQEVMAAYAEGNIFSLMTEWEVKLAEKLVEIIPCADMVRFAKNGADATMGAVRIARAQTGREKILYVTPGYHGCQDWSAITGGWTRGIPKMMKGLINGVPYNDAKALVEALTSKEYAAVIIEQGLAEPARFNSGLQRVDSVCVSGESYLELIRRFCTLTGTIFIMDEIVTGFRYSIGGAQKKYNVTPDLACFGKGMANGMPISLVCGKRHLMRLLEDGVFMSFTFGGDTTAIRAALKVIEIFEKEDVIAHMYELGDYLRNGIHSLASSYDISVQILGNEVRSVLAFLDRQGNESYAMKSLFLQETIKRGILFGVPIFICWKHTLEDIKKTLTAIEEAFKVMQKNHGFEDQAVKGGLVKPPFVRNA